MDLTNASEYKRYAGISSDTQDNTIASLIPKVSALVKTYCRRTFVDYVDEIKVDRFTGGLQLDLTEYPVLQVSSVEYSPNFGLSYTDLTEFRDWVLDTSSEAIVSPYGEFPKAINGYKVSYTAGFEVIPEDLKLAVLDLITYYLKNDGAVHSARSPSANTVQVEYITTIRFPSHIQRVLDQYKANVL